MKFIHCSDLHLGSPNTSLPSNLASIRKNEILHTFERLCAFASVNQVAAIIIAGDLFDVNKVTKKVTEFVLSAIKNTPNVDFLYLSGNHDQFGFNNSLQIPQNLKFFSNSWTKFTYNNVEIYGVCFDGLNQRTIYNDLSPQKDKINIVTLHGQIANYKSTEPAEIISLPSLKNRNIDYLALGHIHSYVVGALDERGIYAYSGCLEGRGFDETGDKGFVLIETNKNSLSQQFIPFASRNIYEVEYEISSENGWGEERQRIINKLLNEYDKNSLIKLTIKGRVSVDYSADYTELSARLNEDFFLVKVVDKSTLKISQDAYEKDKSIKGEFIRLVSASNLSEELKSKVLSCGLNALSGEDLL